MEALTLEHYLTRYGWTYEKHGDVIVSGMETAVAQFLVTFQFSPPWLRISLPIYAPGQARSAVFYARLLQLNDTTRLARFTLTEQGHVALSADIYCEPTLAYALFELNLDIITYIAETAFPQVMGEGQDGFDLKGLSRQPTRGSL